MCSLDRQRKDCEADINPIPAGRLRLVSVGHRLEGKEVIADINFPGRFSSHNGVPISTQGCLDSWLCIMRSKASQNNLDPERVFITAYDSNGHYCREFDTPNIDSCVMA